MSNKGSQLIADFVTKIIHRGNWDEMDRFYLTNQIAHLIGEKELAKESEMTDNQTTILKSVEMLLIQAKENKVIGDSIAESDILESQLMDFIMPSPSLVNQQFYQQYQHSPKKATDYFYELCKTTNYIKTKSVARNILFPAETSYGKLEITINLSKPEKDPKQIVAEKNTLVEHYPKCMLCMENEGYHGRMDYPARTNHRIIRMDLEGESWGFQYSPYAYYNEHAIILSTEHRPMKIGRETFRRLLSITEKLPHYFVGSNADLPIVGGSILAHDHYQAGRHTFPMATAEIETTFCLTNFKQVTAGIVKWPMSVIRLQSTSKNELIEAATLILEKWRIYSDDQVEISAYSLDGTPHHTVTPIARRNGNLFEIDLVLRDNNTSKEFPDGIFHPHPDVQHIKKENIGLIEVMGLAILPPRLSKELIEVKHYLLNKNHEMAEYHRTWAESLKTNATITPENVMEIIQKGVGDVFTQVLIDAGVFKRDKKGIAAFRRFIESIEN